MRIDRDQLALSAFAAHEPADVQVPIDDRNHSRSGWSRRLGTDEQIVAPVDAVLVGLDLGADGDDGPILKGPCAGCS